VIYRLKTRAKSGLRINTAQTTKWNESFARTVSLNNSNMHPFYREYFGKEPKKNPNVFRYTYHSKGQAIGGIVPVGASREQAPVFSTVKYHRETIKARHTRGPTHFASKAFPNISEHIRRAEGWNRNRVGSSDNDAKPRGIREYFDTLDGLAMNEVYD
jgi:hypothetical protein